MDDVFIVSSCVSVSTCCSDAVYGVSTCPVVSVSTWSDAVYGVSACQVVCLFPLGQIPYMMFPFVQLCVSFHLFNCCVSVSTGSVVMYDISVQGRLLLHGPTVGASGGDHP